MNEQWMDEQLIEKTVSSKTMFEGRILSTRVDTVRLPDGSEAKREIVGHNGGVGVVAITKDKEIILVRQYRAGVHGVTLEIPAGKLEKGEEPEACGKRELLEETGFCAGTFSRLVSFFGSPAILEEVIHVFLAQDLSEGASMPDAGEFVSRVKLPFSKAKQMALSGEIVDAKTIIGILLAEQFMK